MILQIVTLTVMGEALALTAIPTAYTSVYECEAFAQKAYLARKDTVSNQLTLDVKCMDSKEMYK